MSKIFLLLINLIVFFHTAAFAIDPYKILRLNPSDSKQTIKERCHDLQRESHPDKGGSSAEFIKYRTACDQLLNPPKEPSAPSFTSQSSDSQQETTNDNSQSDWQKAWDKAQEEIRRQNARFEQANFHFNEPHYSQDNTNFEEWNTSDDSFHQYEEPRAVNIGTIHIIPRIIQSPIYSLSLAESLASKLQHADEHGCWTLAFEPFGKISSGKTHWGFEETEGGLLTTVRYGQKHWFIDFTSSINGCHTTLENHNDYESYKISSTRIVNDSLDSLGFFYDGPCIYAEIKALAGMTSPHCKSEKTLLDIPTVSAGLQASTRYIAHETANSQSLFIGQFRWLYFFKTNAEISLYHQHGSSELKETWQTLSITPGSFIDFLLAIDQRLGSDYQHHFEIGYNPTFHIGGPLYPDILADDHYILNIDNANQNINLTCQSIYGIYTYERMMGNVLTAWSLGAAVHAQKFAHFDSSPATIWASCTIKF